MQPRQILETCKPVPPSRTYSTPSSCASPKSPAATLPRPAGQVVEVLPVSARAGGRADIRGRVRCFLGLRFVERELDIERAEVRLQPGVLDRNQMGVRP